MSFTSSPWRDVYLVAAARGVSVAGDFLAATALVLALQGRGASGYAVAALLLASTVPMVVLAPLGGRLADRFDSRLLLTTVGLAQAACCTLMAFVDHPVALVGLVAVLSAGLAVGQPTFGALVPELVGPQQLPKAMAITQTAAAVGMVAGPGVAGFLVEAYGLRVPLLIDAASYLAIGAAGLAIRTRRGGRPARVHGADQGADTRAGGDPGPPWRLRSDPLLATVVPAMAVVIASVSLVNVVGVFFVRDTLGASPAGYGLIDTAWTGGIIVGAWAVAKKAGTDAALAIALLVSLALCSAVFVVTAGMSALGWLIPLFLLGGCTNGAENTIAQLLIARRVPAAQRGRVIGTWMAVLNAAVAAGFLAAGPVLELLGPRRSLAAAGVAGLVAVAAFTVPMMRATRREPAPADTPQPVTS